MGSCIVAFETESEIKESFFATLEYTTLFHVGLLSSAQLLAVYHFSFRISQICGTLLSLLSLLPQAKFSRARTSAVGIISSLTFASNLFMTQIVLCDRTDFP